MAVRDPGSGRRDDGTEPVVEQPAGEPAADQPTLPLDFDAPVPYRLTAKAVRIVAPGTLPALRVVESPDAPPVPADLDDPHDPRSARARALRRAGVSISAIAAELGVDEVVVRTWTSTVGVHRRRSRAPLHAVPPPTVSEPIRSDREADVAAVHARFAAARDAAAAEAPARLASADFTRGLALTVAAAEIDVHGVVVTLRDRAVAGTVVRWLGDAARAELAALRVVLRLGEIQGADLTAHRWAEALGLPPQRISRARWQAAPTPDAVEALIRIADPVVAGRIAGWRDVLLGAPTLDPSGHDVAF